MFSLLLKISYAPKLLKFLLSKTVLSWFKFCLVNEITLGLFLQVNAISQHSIVSVESHGRKTFKFGIDLRLLKCSIG